MNWKIIDYLKKKFKRLSINVLNTHFFHSCSLSYSRLTGLENLNIPIYHGPASSSSLPFYHSLITYQLSFLNIFRAHLHVFQCLIIDSYFLQLNFYSISINNFQRKLVKFKMYLLYYLVFIN